MRLNKKAAVIAAQKNVLKREALLEKSTKALEKANIRLERALKAVSPEEALTMATELVEKAIEVRSSGTFGGADVSNEELVEISEKGE